MSDLHIEELKKNNFKHNISFSILLPLLLFLKQYLLELLPIMIGSTIVPTITITILGTMGIKFLTNVIKAIKIYRKLKKTNDIEHHKILKEKGMNNIKGIIYVLMLSLCLFLRSNADNYFVSNVAASISTFSTIAVGSMLIGSIVSNVVELIYNKKKIKELTNNDEECNENTNHLVEQNKKTEKLQAIKKELELYNNQLKNSNIDQQLQNQNVKELKK